MRHHVPAARPSRLIEALELRLLLSSYIVTDVGDSGPGSLRADILMSNASPGANTITFATGLSGTITLTTGQLEIASNLTIVGPGAGSLTVSGNMQSRVFQVDAGVTAIISGLTISGGRAPDGAAGAPAMYVNGMRTPGGSGGAGGGGGGIYNLGTLILSADVISSNAAGAGGTGGTGLMVPDQYPISGGPGGAGGRGGGIYSAGKLTVANSSLDSNRAGNGGSGFLPPSNYPYGAMGGLGGAGGAIYSIGPLTISNATIHANRSGDGGASGYPSGGQNNGDGGGGGGIYAGGTLTISGSTIDHNFGGNGGIGNSGSGGGGGGDGGSGGGIRSAGNTVISDSTIDDNAGGPGGVGPGSHELGAGGSGGGIRASTSLTVVNSTISGNSAGDPAGSVSSILSNGGGIDSTGPLRLTNCTVSANSTYLTEGAGLYVGAGAILNNTIVAGNVYIGLPVLQDVVGAVDPASAYNLIGDGMGMTGMTADNHNQIGTDQSRIDPQLGPLGDYGGPTTTMPPSPGSPAIDAGSNALAVGPDGMPLTTDQRGSPRIVDATHTGTASVDIGAVEVAPFPISPFVVTTTADPPLVDYSPNQLSLRQAILFANLAGGPETITFAPGLSGTISGNFELSDTTGKVTIQGLGPNVLLIGGLQVDAKVNAEIDGLGTGPLANSGTITFTNGTVNGLFTNAGTASLSDTTVGGELTNGISHTMSLVQCRVAAPIGNSGTLSAVHSSLLGRVTNDGVATISNASIGGGGAGGISNSGTLTLAGAVLNGTLLDALDNSGTATLTDCTVSASHGVGIANAAGGSLTISGGAVTGNTGGGVSGAANISNCQITNNGGVGVSGRALSLSNCTISGNKGDGIDAGGNLRANRCIVKDNAGRGVNDAAGTAVALTGCTISGNQSPSAGGGIYNPASATLTLTNCSITGNSVAQASGGGIDNLGTLTLINSTVAGNTATAGGGLIPQSSGGGIENAGVAVLVNCTISGNTAAAGAATGAEISGGGIDNSGTLRLTNCTVANNYANAGTSPTNDATGGGIYIAGGHVTLNNTIVAGNYTVPTVGGSPPDDIVGAVGPSSAYNLIGNASAATGLSAANHNQLGTAASPIDPKLGPLGNNGGPTQTMALLSGSPAIDAGSNALAVGPDGKPLLTDQRGYGRIFNGIVDIGAYEYGASIPGDADGDGKVDFNDLVLVARHYGMTNAAWADGDFNYDGSVGFDDLLTVARNYGASMVNLLQAATDAPSLGRPASLSPVSPDVPGSAALARHRRARAIRLNMLGSA